MPQRAYLKDPIIKKAIETERVTGVRYCSKCDKFLPIDQFRDRKTQRLFVCIPHMREMARIRCMGTVPRRAYNSLRCRARQDMLEFGHTKMNIRRAEIIDMLTEEQIAHHGEFCLVPRRPDRPLSLSNSIILSSPQRMYLMGRWRKSRDAIQYMRDLRHILKPAVFSEEEDNDTDQCAGAPCSAEN